jgi:hypothetical protein
MIYYKYINYKIMSTTKTASTPSSTVSAEADVSIEPKNIEVTSSNNAPCEENIQQKAIDHMMTTGMMDYYSMRMMFG